MTTLEQIQRAMTQCPDRVIVNKGNGQQRETGWKVGEKGRKASQVWVGQSLVEVALGLPILLLVVLGLIQFGIGVYDQNVATNAAQSGVRIAAEQDKDLADGEAKARQIIEISLGREVANNSQIDATYTEGGQNVQIQVRLAMPTFVPFLSFGLKFKLSTKATMFKERWMN